MKTRIGGDPAEHLAAMLIALGLQRGVVIAVGRGGARLADRIARGIGAPLDIVLARKVTVGDGHGLVIGAVAAGGARIVAPEGVAALGLTDDDVDRRLAAVAETVEAEQAIMRGNAPVPDLAGRTAILVDDGAVTGLTMVAAAASVRDRAVRQLVAALPFCAEEATAQIANAVHRLVAVEKLPGSIAAMEHTRAAAASPPPPSPEEVYDLLTRRLRDFGADETGRSAPPPR